MTATPTPKEPRTWKTWQLIAASVIALLIGVGIGAATPDDDDEGDAPASSDESSTTEANETTTTETTVRPTTTTAPTTTAPPAPTPADYSITLITESKQCFGSAGCNLTVVPELSIVGPAALNTAVRLTYQIDGDESGPIVETIDVSADGQYQARSTNMSTANEGVVPTVTITAVR